MPSFENPNHKSQKEEEPPFDKTLQSAEKSFKEAVSPEEEKRMQKLKIFETENPEVLEQVMGKVQDIGVPGIAFSGLLNFPLVRSESNFFSRQKQDFDSGLLRLGHILKRGLSSSLPSTGQENDAFYRDWQSSKTPVEYRESLKERRDEGYHKHVFFNITGRFDDRFSGDKPFKPNDVLDIGYTQYTNTPDNLAIIFDISDLEEKDGRKDLGNTVSPGAYAPDDLRGYTFFYNPSDGSINDSKQEGGEQIKMVDSEFGFVTRPRIAPRRFQGIVYSAIKEQAEYYWDKENKVFRVTKDAEYCSEAELVRLARNIAATMVEVNEEHPERIIPIYDSRGYLLWPKCIPYSELKETLRDSLIKKIGERKEIQ